MPDDIVRKDRGKEDLRRFAIIKRLWVVERTTAKTKQVAGDAAM